MICAWDAFLSILPVRLRKNVDFIGHDLLQELRLRVNAPPELVLYNEIHYLSGGVTGEDLQYIINAASKYSPWCASSLSQGYITAYGGHRIGVCGGSVFNNGMVSGIRDVTSVCIRIARDFPGIGELASIKNKSLLVLGAPGWGKTTLLRDIIRNIGKKQIVCVIDERGELFPDGMSRGNRVDVMTGCPKQNGVDILLRSMGPQYIALDEITEEQDCEAILNISNCGVKLLASAHAYSKEDFYSRRIYKKLIEGNVFDALIILNQDKSYRVERIA